MCGTQGLVSDYTSTCVASSSVDPTGFNDPFMNCNCVPQRMLLEILKLYLNNTNSPWVERMCKVNVEMGSS